MAVADDELAELSACWERRHANRLPVGHLLGRGARNWVRFHALPGSKRYPDDEAEYAEILRRHFTVLGELGSGDPVWVMTNQWSEGEGRGPDDRRRLRVHPVSRFWRSVREVRGPDEEIRWHIFVSLEAPTPERIGGLLRAVADEEQIGVTIADRELTWLFHPYDGGADIFARDVEQRDQLRVTHADWLSRHPRGF